MLGSAEQVDLLLCVPQRAESVAALLKCSMKNKAPYTGQNLGVTGVKASFCHLFSQLKKTSRIHSAA